MKKYIVKENGETVGVFLNAGQACALNDEYMKYGRSCTIDIVTEPDETETNEQEETKMKNAEFIANVRTILNGRKCRSAWDRGVMQYAEELTAELAENINGGYITLEQLATAEGRKAALLNGAKDWSQYSYGGSALIYDYEIAERLCSPSELKRTRGGERNPNSRETWLDCQARALAQASSKVRRIIRGVLYDLGMEVH
jgi:hypothetical protein